MFCFLKNFQEAKQKRLLSPNRSTEVYIKEIIQEARLSLDSLFKAQKNQYFTHPIFGDLQLRKAIKFLGVHTNHHEKIIRDILK